MENLNLFGDNGKNYTIPEIAKEMHLEIKEVLRWIKHKNLNPMLNEQKMYVLPMKLKDFYELSNAAKIEEKKSGENIVKKEEILPIGFYYDETHKYWVYERRHESSGIRFWFSSRTERTKILMLAAAINNYWFSENPNKTKSVNVKKQKILKVATICPECGKTRHYYPSIRKNLKTEYCISCYMKKFVSKKVKRICGMCGAESIFPASYMKRRKTNICRDCSNVLRKGRVL